MAKKIEKQTGENSKIKCADKLCAVHGKQKVRVRGRTFEGVVTKKLHGRVSIELERMIKIPKYERYEKRKTKIHARLSPCIEETVELGDRIQVAETRPISKMIHFVVTKVIRKKLEKQ